MGLVHAEIELSNPRDDSLKPVTAPALVDTGATTLCLPEHLAIQLQLKEIEKRDVVTADGREHSIPYVGPIQVRFDNRNSFSGALVIGDSVLMGAIQMEDMDLVVHPRTQTVTVNPASPNTPLVIVK
ncbi:MAG: clan AA aspartic protease [Gammaproteobacteria bacterium]|nr:clan AA aspartic protease [Gammaproteobacteria bacterium]MDD9875077.1 clan AA aspartic protease [Gammaproteobacteria bacterium]